MIDLRPDHLEIVRDLLRQHVPGCEVRAFGSRFKWTAKQASDLDLAVVGTKRLPSKKIMRLKEAFEESILPMRVDVLDWHAITPEFQRVIDAGFEVIQEGGEVSPLAPASSPSAAGSSATPLSQFAHSVGENTSVSWIETRIGDQVLLQRGIDITKAEQVFGAVPVISSGGTSSYHAVPAAKGPGVILGRKGVVGSVYYIQDDYWPHDTTLWVKDFKGNYPKFVYYFFKNFAPRLANLDVGSANPTLNRNHVHPIKVKWPSLANQKGIAQVLGSLEDRIELCRRTNRTLESMARALFKDWFIDFGPVRAKLEGREPYLSTDVWSLFPDRLVDSELGEIPEGWEWSTIGASFNLIMGQSPPGDTYNDLNEGLPFFQGRTDFGFRYPDNRKYCSAPTRVANAEDTLVSVRAPVGDINMAWEKCCIGRGIAALRHKSGSRSFTYYTAWAIQNDLRQFEHNGTIFGAINKSQFERLKVIGPSHEILEEFNSSAERIDSQIRINILKIRNLISLRDSLLPKLLSGELGIPDALLMVEETVG